MKGTETPAGPTKWLTPEQAGEVLGIHRRTVIARINDGIIPALKIGRLWRIRPEDLPTPTTQETS